jgi:hypothetical protein
LFFTCLGLKADALPDFDAEVVSTGCKGVSVLAGDDRPNQIREMTMKRELEFVSSFTLSVLLLAGSFAVAQNATTTTTKKKPSATASAAQGAASTSATQTDAATAAQTSASAAPANQASAAAPTTKPKTMVSKDKRTIPVPQL